MEETKVIPTDKLVKTYIKIRDARKEMADKYEREDNELKEALESIEQELLEACKSIGADSIRTPFGTLTRSVKKRYWTNDWDSMYRFIKEHDAYGLLEKRIQQTHMKEFLAENPDVYPQGMNVENQFTVVVRRKKEE